MKEEDKIHINSFKFYDRDELEELTKEYYLENQQLKGNLQTYEIILRANVEENDRLKEQYCERTDCSGRLGNSKKVEQLQTEKEQLTSLVNSCQEEIRRLNNEKQQLKNNWNDLKKYLLGGISSNNVFVTENSMLSKMQEIERNDK